MNIAKELSRRDCMKSLALGAVALSSLGGLPALGATSSATRSATRLGDKRLVSLMLSGGNDGINMLVPYRESAYRALRPTLALAAEACLTLNDQVAFHPSLKGLHGMYEQGELAIVQAVGQQQVGDDSKDLSHFVSSDVWWSGEVVEAHVSEGWYGNVIADNADIVQSLKLDADAMLFTPGYALARGEGVKVFSSTQLPRGGDAVQSGERVKLDGRSSSMLRKLATSYQEGQDMLARVSLRLAGAKMPQPNLNEQPITQQVKLLQWVMGRGLRVPVYKIEQSGYDTHAGQVPRQAELYTVLDDALVILRDSLRAQGLWNDTVVMIYSEFGRRPAQTLDGTDHGNAGPTFLLGGKVSGGIYGSYPSLEDLDKNGNLKHNIDLRNVYTSVIRDLWRMPASRPEQAGFAGLNIGLG